MQRKYEEKYNRDILESLKFIPNLTVRTSVQLNPEKINRSESTNPTKGEEVRKRSEKSSSAA